MNVLLKNYSEIAQKLEMHHELFYQFWNIGEPIFTDSIPTAAVSYDRYTKEVSFLFNEKFYKSLDEYSLLFIICHEFLHVILQHLERMKVPKLQEISNIVMDVVVNEMLVRSFGFNRDKIKDNKNLCWRDTTFKNKNVEKNREFEYYFNQLADQIEIFSITIVSPNSNDKSNDSKELGKGNIVGSGGCDSHENFGEIGGEAAKEIMEKIGQHMSKEARDSLKSIAQQAGVKGGNLMKIAKAKTKPNPKWETVIQDWARKQAAPADKEQWARTNRRFTCLPRDMFIPTEMETDAFDKTKIEVWFFQDTSGSCYNFRDRFFAAAKSLPPEKFDIRMFCFDTKVFETTLKSGKLYGFGGTRFQILENKVQEIISKEKISYPKAIFVISDGYSSDVIAPKHPKRWHWFLSEDYKRCIDNKCNFHVLKDFE